VVSRLSFDDIPEFGQVPRPDYLLLLDDGEIVIVEETGRPEFRDLKRVIDTVVMLKEGRLSLPYHITPFRITGVVHYRRKDTTFGKHLSSQQKRLWEKYGIRLLGVSCERDLQQRLRIASRKANRWSR